MEVPGKARRRKEYHKVLRGGATPPGASRAVEIGDELPGQDTIGPQRQIGGPAFPTTGSRDVAGAR